MGLVVAVGLAEVISVVTILESVAALGAVLSVVGMVTKNKTLSMVGAGLGVVGGFGALAAGALGGGAALFAADTVGTTAAGDAAAVAEAGDSAFVGAETTGALGGGVAGPALTTETAGIAASDAVPDVVGGLSASQAAAAPAENVTLASTAQDVAPTATNAADAVAPGTTGAVTPATGLPDTTVATTATPTTTGASAAPGASPGVDAGVWDTPVAAKDASGVSGTLGKLVTYAGDHPVVALGALQAGGSLLTGAFSSLTPAQVTALNAQAAANDAAAALTRQQTANLAMPKSVASSAPVTGTPQALVPPPPQGFINQPRPLVTGAPA